ncbi:MAG TPA: type I methionyl aminopeptidase [Terriglobales bacterium]|nr:type I methionyl aminopeptidase [Terriglobales bacterium]
MIVRRSSDELKKLRRAGLVVAEVLRCVANEARPGRSTWDLEEVADRVIREQQATSAFRGYRGFPCVLCVSVNEQIIHGIPSRKRILVEGDIVSLDCGVVVDGYYGDSATTVVVGAPEQVPERVRKLMDVTQLALADAIQQARVGQRLGDISQAVEKRALREGFSVVREFVGHGIGTHLHEDPQVPNYGPAGTGPKLRAGMVLAIEPMINLGAPEVRVLADGWTAVTADGQPSAHFEHTVAITDSGPWVLTQPD